MTKFRGVFTGNQNLKVRNHTKICMIYNTYTFDQKKNNTVYTHSRAKFYLCLYSLIILLLFIYLPYPSFDIDFLKKNVSVFYLEIQNSSFEKLCRKRTFFFLFERLSKHIFFNIGIVIVVWRGWEGENKQVALYVRTLITCLR